MSDVLSPDEVQRRYRVRFWRMRMAGLPLGFATWVLLMWLDDEPSFLGQPMTLTAPLALAVFAICCLVSWRVWRCPACDKHLTGKVHPYQCPSCAVALRPDLRRPRVQ